MVTNLRGKAAELLEDRDPVAGLKDVKRQLRQLDKRWNSLKVRQKQAELKARTRQGLE